MKTLILAMTSAMATVSAPRCTAVIPMETVVKTNSTTRTAAREKYVET
jgi:hypothetical protein